MEKRVGVIAILISQKTTVQLVNDILSHFSHLVLGRMGIPMPSRGISVISLIIEGSTDGIGALTGKLGRLDGVEVKSTLTRYRGEPHDPEPKATDPFHS